MTGIRSEVLLKLQRFSKRRSNIADKENATSELNIQFRSSFSLVLVPRVLNVTKFQGMKNGFEETTPIKSWHTLYLVQMLIYQQNHLPSSSLSLFF